MLLQLPLSVTRSGDLLDFGQISKAFCNNYFAQISHILVKVLKSIIFLENHFWATFIDIWRFFLVALLPLNVGQITVVSTN